MRYFYTPDWLYERLPQLYIASGAGSILALQNGLATASGVLLCATGAVTWNLRRTYRARQDRLKQLRLRRQRARRH